jgi:parallel beta-helix repeat protein
MRRIYLALLCACAVVAGCGGGRQESPAAAESFQPAVRAALNASTPDATQLMDWAETHYPQFFPSHQADQIGYGYTYRYYPATGNYLGVSGTDVAVLGPLSGGNILKVGTLADFACDVDPAGCLPDVIAQPQSTAVAPGAVAAFELALSPASPAAVQWQLSTDGGQSFTNIAGANSATYTVSSFAADNSKVYRAQVSNLHGTVLTSAAHLTVATPTILKSCADITTPGLYVLGADLKASSSSNCLNVHDTTDVHIDCAGHAVAQSANVDTYPRGNAVLIDHVAEFSVRNCTFDDDQPNFNNSRDGSIAHNTFTNNRTTNVFAQVFSSTRVQFYANTVLGTLALYYNNQSTITGNTFRAPPGFDTGALASSFAGHGTLIAANTIDGAYVGGAWHLAADDGILLLDDHEPIVEDNVISNVYDTGIEWTGLLDAAKIRRNRITNTGYSGFGGWYWMSSINSQFVDNDIYDSPTMFEITRSSGLRATDTGVYFTGNRFEGNVFHSQDTNTVTGWLFVYNYLQYSLGGIMTLAPGERDATAADFHISGNVFLNNDFGHASSGPWFGYGDFVPGMIIDGGGNSCKPLQGSPAPLACN